MNEIHVKGHFRAKAGPTVTLSRYGWKYDSHLTAAEARAFAQDILLAADVAEAVSDQHLRCGHPTKKGTPCKNPPWSSRQQHCSTHITEAERDEDRRAHIAEVEQLRAQREAERIQAQRDAEPAPAKYERDAFESIEEALQAQADLNKRPSEVRRTA